jgi:hypothetical protein
MTGVIVSRRLAGRGDELNPLETHVKASRSGELDPVLGSNASRSVTKSIMAQKW